MAWLHATPKPDPRSKRAKNDTAPRTSRIEEYRRRKEAPPMPPNPLPHIIQRLIEIGLTEAAGMSVVALSWREIAAWGAETGVSLDPWEKRLIRRLSAAYVAESRLADSENCPPPWRAEVTDGERDTEEARLRALLG